MKNIGYSYNGFTTARLKRFLRTGGQTLTFIAWGLNEYNEPAVASSEILILGVPLADSMVNSSTNNSASSKIRSNKAVAIITSWESLVTGFSGGKELLPDMTIELNEVGYKIVKVENVNNWGIVAEISLEEYDEWKH